MCFGRVAETEQIGCLQSDVAIYIPLYIIANSHDNIELAVSLCNLVLSTKGLTDASCVPIKPGDRLQMNNARLYMHWFEQQPTCGTINVIASKLSAFLF